MKYLYLLSIAFLISPAFSLSTFAASFQVLEGEDSVAELIDPKEYKTVFTQPERVTLIRGFDSNDNVQIFFQGSLPSTCHYLGPTSFSVTELPSQGKKKKTEYLLKIKNAHLVKQNTLCSQVRSPYHRILDLGTLKMGDYKVQFYNKEDKKDFWKNYGKLFIAKATKNSQDDHLYAPVTGVAFVGKKLKLHGFYTNTCMRVKEVKTIPYSNEDIVSRSKIADYVVVLPLAEIVKRPGLECKTIDSPISEYAFSVEVSLSKILYNFNTLFHIRSMGGKSLHISPPRSE